MTTSTTPADPDLPTAPVDPTGLDALRHRKVGYMESLLEQTKPMLAVSISLAVFAGIILFWTNRFKALGPIPSDSSHGKAVGNLAQRYKVTDDEEAPAGGYPSRGSAVAASGPSPSPMIAGYSVPAVPAPTKPDSDVHPNPTASLLAPDPVGTANRPRLDQPMSVCDDYFGDALDEYAKPEEPADAKATPPKDPTKDHGFSGHRIGLVN